MLHDSSSSCLTLAAWDETFLCSTAPHRLAPRSCELLRSGRRASGRFPPIRRPPGGPEMSSKLHQLRPSNMMKPEVEGGVATFVCSWLVQFESNLSNYCTLYYYVYYIYIIIIHHIYLSGPITYCTRGSRLNPIHHIIWIAFALPEICRFQVLPGYGEAQLLSSLVKDRQDRHKSKGSQRTLEHKFM